MSGDATPAPGVGRAVRLALGRIALVLGGLMVALVLVELGLRLAGPLIAPPGKPPADAADWRVLCVGDSFVYGLGSEDGRGMCEHLQELLDQRWGPGVASVHNEGVPGFNSSQVADRFDGWLERYDPQAVVLLVGHNNGWNFNDLHLGLVDGGAELWLARSLGGLRLVRLQRLVTRYADDGGAGSGSQTLEPELEAWSKVAREASKKQKSSQQIQELEARLEAHPEDVFSMMRLALALDASGRDGDALAWRERARITDAAAVGRLEAAQYRVERFHQEQSHRGEDLHLREDPSADAALFRSLSADTPPDALVDEQRRVLDAVLRADLEQMVASARERGAAVVVSSYPQPKHADGVLARTAAELDLVFVDQQTGFEKRLTAQDDQSPWFVLDGHCTSAGYRIMAENLAPAVLALRSAGVERSGG